MSLGLPTVTQRCSCSCSTFLKRTLHEPEAKYSICKAVGAGLCVVFSVKPSDLALGGRHLCEQSLGNLGPLHLLLDLIVDVGADVEDGALGFAVPLAGQRRRLHLAFNTKLITPLVQTGIYIYTHTHSINIKQASSSAITSWVGFKLPSFLQSTQHWEMMSSTVMFTLSVRMCADC